MPSGGHFAALDEPLRLVDDLRAFFRPLNATALRGHGLEAAQEPA
jgi:hypothetical protein